MSLSGSKLKQLEAALLTAFPGEGDLLRFVTYSDPISEAATKITAGNLQNQSFALIQWALANGKLDDLINEAENANGGNPELKAFIAEYRPDAIPIQPIPCPYPGLRAFDAADAPFFFGREEEINNIAQLLNDSQLVVLAGPSGSGKTSLIYAGLLPHLEKEQPGIWHIANVPVSVDPTSTLAYLLDFDGNPDNAAEAVNQLVKTHNAQRILVVIDQFELIFRITANSVKRDKFFALLYMLSTIEYCHVLLISRSDFYSELQKSFSWAIEQNSALMLVDIEPMNRKALEAAIEKPAHLVHIKVDSGLRVELSKAVDKEPGALVWLQAVIRQLWMQRSADVLTLQLYEQLGTDPDYALGWILAAHTQNVLAKVVPEQRDTLFRIVLRLIKVVETPTVICQTVTDADLFVEDENADSFNDLLETLAQLHFVVLSGERSNAYRQVSLAHSYLVTAWSQLYQWIKDHYELEIIRRDLKPRVVNWVKDHRSPLDDAELEAAERLLEHRDLKVLGVNFSQLQQLVQASQASQQEAARLEKEEAAQQIRQSILAKKTLVKIVRDGQVYEQDLSPIFISEKAVLSVVYTLDGSNVIADSQDRGVGVWNSRDGEGQPLPRLAQQIIPLHFNADGRQFIAVSSSGDVELWNVSDDKEPVWTRKIISSKRLIYSTFSNNGSIITVISDIVNGALVSGNKTLLIWSIKGETLFNHKYENDIEYVELTNVLPIVVTMSINNELRLWRGDQVLLTLRGYYFPDRGYFNRKRGDHHTTSHENPEETYWIAPLMSYNYEEEQLEEEQAEEEPAKKEQSIEDQAQKPKKVAIIPLLRSAITNINGDKLLVLTKGGLAQLWDVQSKKIIAILPSSGSDIWSAVFSPDDKWVVTTNNATAQLWDASTGEEMAVLSGHSAAVITASFSSDSQWVATGSKDGTVRQYDIGSLNLSD